MPTATAFRENWPPTIGPATERGNENVGPGELECGTRPCIAFGEGNDPGVIELQVAPVMVSGKPLLPPAAITPIPTAAKEQKEDDNDKNEFHSFLQLSPGEFLLDM